MAACPPPHTGLLFGCPLGVVRGGRRSRAGKEQSKIKTTSEEDSMWEHPEREHTVMEQKKLIAAMLEIGIIASFSLHTYTFAGRIYQQRLGGPIGSRLTMAVSQIVMSMLGLS